MGSRGQGGSRPGLQAGWGLGTGKPELAGCLPLAAAEVGPLLSGDSWVSGQLRGPGTSPFPPTQGLPGPKGERGEKVSVQSLGPGPTLGEHGEALTPTLPEPSATWPVLPCRESHSPWPPSTSLWARPASPPSRVSGPASCGAQCLCLHTGGKGAPCRVIGAPASSSSPGPLRARQGAREGLPTPTDIFPRPPAHVLKLHACTHESTRPPMPILEAPRALGTSSKARLPGEGGHGGPRPGDRGTGGGVFSSPGAVCSEWSGHG